MSQAPSPGAVDGATVIMLPKEAVEALAAVTDTMRGGKPVTLTVAMPKAEAKVAPKAEAKVAPKAEAKVAPKAEAKVETETGLPADAIAAKRHAIRAAVVDGMTGEKLDETGLKAILDGLGAPKLSAVPASMLDTLADDIAYATQDADGFRTLVASWIKAGKTDAARLRSALAECGAPKLSELDAPRRGAFVRALTGVGLSTDVDKSVDNRPVVGLVPDPVPRVGVDGEPGLAELLEQIKHLSDIGLDAAVTETLKGFGATSAADLKPEYYARAMLKLEALDLTI